MNVQYDPSFQGYINERRFFQVLREARDRGEIPGWVVRFWKAVEYEDKAGVDGFALIRAPDSGEQWRVPFQIKSSVRGISHQQQKDKVFWIDNLRYFVINPSVSDVDIVDGFIKTMTKIRKKGERFHQVLASLEEARMLDRQQREERAARPALLEFVLESESPRLSWLKKVGLVLQKIRRK